MEYVKDNQQILDIIKSNWELFKKDFGHYPTSNEIDSNPNILVSTRTIQRRFGGLLNVRKLLGHDITDYSSGEVRSEMAAKCLARSYDEEIMVKNFLYLRFGKKPNVIGWEPYNDMINRFCSDVGVYYRKGHFFVDIFSAKDESSLSGCVLAKQKKIEKSNVKDKVYLVSSSPTISQEQIDKFVNNKKLKLPKNVIVLTFENFKKECEKYHPKVSVI